MRHISWTPEIPYASIINWTKVTSSSIWSRRSIRTWSHLIPTCSNEIRIKTDPCGDPEESNQPNHPQTILQDTWWSPWGSTWSLLSAPQEQEDPLKHWGCPAGSSNRFWCPKDADGSHGCCSKLSKLTCDQDLEPWFRWLTFPKYKTQDCSMIVLLQCSGRPVFQKLHKIW